MSLVVSLDSLGWRPHFQLQLDAEQALVPARVTHVHRGRIDVVSEGGHQSIVLDSHSATLNMAVGDWVLLNNEGKNVRQRLRPFGVFQRRAAGASAEIQTIAANVDTVFIVTSANRDFNVARLERYLAIARDAEAFPVVVITKADTVSSTDEYVSAASPLSTGLLVETMDARKSKQVDVLRAWCGSGQTVALLGSSGVGKSTIVNTLAGAGQETSSARDDDQRGRHTTTGRSMHALQGGGWLIDTPGMRELQLVDIGSALDDVFADVSSLAEGCRFGDCQHESEPGCAVRMAINNDALSLERLQRYRKLQSEDRRNSESVAERRSRDKHFGKLIKSTLVEKQHRKGG